MPKIRRGARAPDLETMLRSIDEMRANQDAFRALRRLLAPSITETGTTAPTFRRSMDALKPYVPDASIRFLLVAMASAKTGGQNRVIRCWKKCKEGAALPEVVPDFEGPEPGSTDFDPEHPPGDDGEYEVALECWIKCTMEVIPL